MNIFSILMFLHKNLIFHQDFLLNFGFFCKFVKKYKLQFIYVLMSFLFVSSYVSICILLKFMYSKFQLSNSKIWLSYEYSNMPHLLVNTLYYLKTIWGIKESFLLGKKGLWSSSSNLSMSSQPSLWLGQVYFYTVKIGFLSTVFWRRSHMSL